MKNIILKTALVLLAMFIFIQLAKPDFSLSLGGHKSTKVEIGSNQNLIAEELPVSLVHVV